MCALPIVQLKEGQYWCDINVNGTQESTEVFSLKDAQGNTEQAKVEYQLNHLLFRGSTPGCFPRQSATIFRDMKSYLNVPTPKYRDLDKVVKFRQSLKEEIDRVAFELKAYLATNKLPENHPFSRLAKEVTAIQLVLDRVRIQLIQASGQNEGQAQQGANMVSLIPASKLEYHVHELDHVNVESQVENWTNTFTVVQKSSAQCQVSMGGRPYTNPKAKRTLNVMLDFSAKKQQPVYDDAAINYRTYPIRLDGKDSCVPKEFNESTWASEVHAYQVESRWRLFVQDQENLNQPSYVSNADLISALKTGGQQAARAKTQIKTKFKEKDDPIPFYFSVGGASGAQDLYDFVKAQPQYAAKRSSPSCVPPQLPSLQK